MKEERYQSMYQQIHLSNRQKQDIWSGVEERAGKSASGRTMRLSLRGAVCVCAVLIASGFSVLAANSSYVEKIAAAMGFYGGSNEEPSPMDNELYAAYGTEIHDTWEMESGTIQLDAVFFDKGYLCVPFTVYPAVTLTPGSDISSERLYGDFISEAVNGGKGEQYYFRLEGGREGDFSMMVYINPVVQADGSLTGSYLMEFERTENGGFAQGDVIQRVKKEPLPEDGVIGRKLEEGESAEGLKTYDIEVDGEIVTFVDLTPEEEVLAEFRLESAPLPQKEISTAGMELPYGIASDQITISPLALYMYGTGDFDQPGSKIKYNIHVVLKDGTVVETVGSAASMSLSREDENGGYVYDLSMRFVHTIELDDVAGVSITDQGEELCFIPVH